jgi:hypothetical protein
MKGRKQEMKKGTEQNWQTDPNTLDTHHVQVWSDGGSMLTAQCPLADAKKMVQRGAAFVISGQAIGHYDERG